MTKPQLRLRHSLPIEQVVGDDPDDGFAQVEVDLTGNNHLMSELPHEKWDREQRESKLGRLLTSKPATAAELHKLIGELAKEGFMRTAVVCKSDLKFWEKMEPGHWGFIVAMLRYIPAVQPDFKPIKVRWVNGTESFHDRRELSLIMRGLSLEELTDKISSEQMKLCT